MDRQAKRLYTNIGDHGKSDPGLAKSLILSLSTMQLEPFQGDSLVLIRSMSLAIKQCTITPLDREFNKRKQYNKCKATHLLSLEMALNLRPFSRAFLQV
jgi:hypothetical protein